MTLKQKQKKVSEIEALGDSLLELSKADLISTLRDYSDCVDYIGVKGNPEQIAAVLRKRYNSIEELSSEIKKAKNKDSLFLCIIGNFIYSEGQPPPNVMWRFCSEYLLDNGPEPDVI